MTGTAIPSARSCNTGLNSDELVARDLFQECVCVSPSGVAFSIYINTCVSKFVQFGCKGGRIVFPAIPYLCRGQPILMAVVLPAYIFRTLPAAVPSPAV